MKVLVFTSLYPNNVWPNQGVFIKERMTHFVKFDECEMKIVAPVPYFPPVKINWRWSFSRVARWEVRDGVEVYHPKYYMIPKIGMSLYGLMMFLSVLGTIKKIRKNFDFDLIDAHFVYPDGFAAVLLGWFFKKPVVVTARGSDINRYSRFPVIRSLLRYTLLNSDRVVAVSQRLKEATMRLGVPDSKICVIPNGVDTQKFFPVVKTKARQMLNLAIGADIIVSVGHLTRNKGFHLLIRAMKILTQQSPQRNIFLIIVGDGQCRKELEDMVAALGLDRNIQFQGSVAHEQLAVWYSAADLFCLASEMEGWPNVLLESLACGTPVVATAVGGIPEIIRSNKIGLLVDRHEMKISEAINAGLNKRWLSEDLLEYARHHSWDCAAGAVREVFQSVLNCDRRSSGGSAACDLGGSGSRDSVPLGSTNVVDRHNCAAVCLRE